MLKDLKTLLLAGAVAFASPLLGGCGAVCGDGTTDAGEACDDGNTDAGDGCDAVCAFEDPKTEFRIDGIALEGAQFVAPNLLLDAAVGQDDLTKALNILIEFDSTVDAATTAQFGTGVFDPAAETFSFGLAVTADVNNAGGEIAFAAPVDIALPIELEVGSGNFANLPVRQADVSGTFVKKQNQATLLFEDIIDDGVIDAQVTVFDLCALNIDIDGDPANVALVNLLDVFDDGRFSPDPNIPASALFPPQGTAPDATNCVPCNAPDPNVNCLSPDIADPNGAGNDLYTVGATFTAKANVVIQ
jgi:cysteine-rich repeat protein